MVLFVDEILVQGRGLAACDVEADSDDKAGESIMIVFSNDTMFTIITVTRRLL